MGLPFRERLELCGRRINDRALWSKLSGMMLEGFLSVDYRELMEILREIFNSEACG